MDKEIYITVDDKLKKEKSFGKSILMILVLINSIVFMKVEFLNVYRDICFLNIPILMFALLLNGKISKKSARNLFLLLTYTIYSISSMLVNGGGFGSAINNIYGLFIFVAFSQFNFKDKDLKKILFFYLVLNLFWIVKSKGYYDKIIYEGIHNINPNVIAYIILFTTMLICILLQKLKYRYNKAMIVFIILISIIAIIRLEARGTLVSIIVFIILNYMISKDFYRKRKKSLSYIYAIVVLIGIVFPILYLSMYRNGIDFKFPLIDKNLYSGREIIWSNFYLMLDDLKKWLFGLGSKVTLIDSERVDLHNNYLAILCNFGILGFIGYYGFIIKNINDICKSKRLTDFTISLLIAFLCVLINGYFEATIYFSPIFMFMFIFLGIAYRETEKERYAEKELFNNEQI